MSENKLCFICLETCKKPGVLDLKCECDYIVHKNCFDKWYKIKKTCIICHEECHPIKKNGTIILRRNISRSNVNIQINNNGYSGILFWVMLFFIFKFYTFFGEKILQNNDTLPIEN